MTTERTIQRTRRADDGSLSPSFQMMQTDMMIVKRLQNLQFADRFQKGNCNRQFPELIVVQFSEERPQAMSRNEIRVNIV